MVDRPSTLSIGRSLIPVAIACTVLGSAAAGAVVALHGTLAIIVAVVPSVLLLIRLRPAQLLVVALGFAWFSKTATAIGIAPRLLEFADFPIVLLAGFICLTSVPSRYARVRVRLGAGIVAMLMVIGTSSVVNASGLVRGVSAAALLLEAPVALYALLRPGISRNDRQLLALTLTAILVTQFVFVLWQAPGAFSGDDVRGTLLGAGAGAHVMGGSVLLLCIAVPRLLSLSVRWEVILAIGGVATAFLADAKGAILVAVIALALSAVVGRKLLNNSRRIAVAIAVVGVVMVGISSGVVPEARAKADTMFSDEGKVGALRAVLSDMSDRRGEWILGFGPGETVSRLALLTSAEARRSGSPVVVLGLRPARELERFTVNLKLPSYLASSANSPFSSALGVLGDYGVVGALVMLYIFAVVLVGLVRSSSQLTLPGLTAWFMLILLSCAFDWLEQPPFSLIVVAIVGLTLTDEAHGVRN